MVWAFPQNDWQEKALVVYAEAEGLVTAKDVVPPYRTIVAVPRDFLVNSQGWRRVAAVYGEHRQSEPTFAYKYHYTPHEEKTCWECGRRFTRRSMYPGGDWSSGYCGC